MLFYKTVFDRRQREKKRTRTTVRGNKIIKMENRDELIAIQTPQGFNYLKLLHSHEKFTNEASDDIRIMLEDNHTCIFLEGPEENIKITKNSDLKRILKFMEIKT